MAYSATQLKSIDDDAVGMGRRCRCPCACGARKFSYNPLFSLPPELAKALDVPMTNFVDKHAMLEWKKDMYFKLRDSIQEALDYAFVQWKMPDGAKVLLDGSALKGTALDDSDMDLVVRTTYRVPRSVKLKAHQIIKAKLLEEYGNGNVSITEKRKSAEFVVEAHRRTAAAVTIDASDVDDDDDDESAQDELRVEWKALAPAAESSRTTAVAREYTKLYADVLFENATVGLPLSNIQTFPDEGIKPVQMMKLFQRKGGSLPPLKGYVIEALVQHVLECGQPSEPNGAPNPLPTESVAQAFYMTLTLFLVEPSARDLDNRVCHNLAVPSGFLFDRGDFDCWRMRVKSFTSNLIKLATCLSRDTAKKLDPDELFRRIVERSAPWKAPSAAAATSAAASPGDGGSHTSSKSGGEAHADKAEMPFLKLVAKFQPDVEKARVSLGCKHEVNPTCDLGQWEPDAFLRSLEMGPQSTRGSVPKPGPNVTVSEEPEAPAPPSPPSSSQSFNPSPVVLDSQQSFTARGSSGNPAVAATAAPSGAQDSPPGGTRRLFTGEELLAAIDVISPAPQNMAQQRQSYDGTFVTVSNARAGPCVDVDGRPVFGSISRCSSISNSNSSSSSGGSSFAASTSLVCGGAIDHPLAALFAHPLADEARRLCYMYRYPSAPQIGLLPPVHGPLAPPQQQPPPPPQPSGYAGHMHPRRSSAAVEATALARSSPRPSSRPALSKETDVAECAAEPAMHALSAPASSHGPETAGVFSLSRSIRESLSRSKPGCGGHSGSSSSSRSGGANTNIRDGICGAAGSGSLAPLPGSTDRSATGRSGLAAEINAPSSAAGEVPEATPDCDPGDSAPAGPSCSGSTIRAGSGRTRGNEGENGGGGRGGNYGGSSSSDEENSGGGRGAVPPELEAPAAKVQAEWAQAAAPGLPDQSASRWTVAPSIPVSAFSTATAAGATATATATATAAAAAAAATAAAIDTVVALTATHLDPMHLPPGAHADVAAAAAEAATATALNAMMQPSTSVHSATAERLRSEVIPRYLQRLQALLRDAQERRIQGR